MDRASRPSDAPASSSAFCPACQKPIDALRAGQVAILDGAFRYFCDATCKGAYLAGTSTRSGWTAVETEAPPAVSVARSGVRPQMETLPEAALEGLAPPVLAIVAESEREIVAEPEEGGAPDRSPVSEHEQEHETETGHGHGHGHGHGGKREVAPSTLRSPDVAAEKKRSRSGGALRRRLEAVGGWAVRGAPIAGVAAGGLAAVVGLAGEGAGVVRLPLALFATAILVGRGVLGARERAEPAQWVVVLPVFAAAIVAAVAVTVHDPHADAHAIFVGLAAAAGLGAEILVARARRGVLEARARTRAGLAGKARVVRGDDLVEVDAALVKPGEQIVVDAGETALVDGIVAAGEGEVAPWLDSPALLKKKEGDAVVAGAAVVSGRLRINATFSGPDRAWLRLIDGSAPPIDVAAPLVTYVRRIVLRGALVSAAAVGGAVFADNGSAFDVAIAACAGGFALAAAFAVSAAALAHARGHVAAQRRGIVYKDAAAFDAAARADIAVVCSRGTILLGEPEIIAVEPIRAAGGRKQEQEPIRAAGGRKQEQEPIRAAGGRKQEQEPIRAAGGRKQEQEPIRAAGGREQEQEPIRSAGGGLDKDGETERVLAIAAGAEMSSTHPFAAAVLRAARARGVRPDTVRSALGHSGLGVTALSASGDRVIVGSRAFLLQETVSVAIADARTSELEAEGRSVLLVAVGGRLVGLLALQDGLRPGARAAIQRMHDARIEPVLLSGEARDTCETIARALDIEHVRPEILPSDRGAEVRALADGGHVVAAIGHAATDDGALGAADVSVAMAAAGAAPGEWAVALASDDVRDGAVALTVARAARDRAKTALIVGGLVHAASAVGIAFRIGPPAIVPVLGIIAVAAVVTVVRDPGMPES